MTGTHRSHLQAALTIAALRADERQWVMQRLSNSERANLDAALRDAGAQPFSELATVLTPALPTGSTPSLRMLARRLPLLAETILQQPAWTWPVIGAVLDSALRQRVLQWMAQSATHTSQLAALQRAWQPGAPRQAAEMRTVVLEQLGVLLANTVSPASPAWTVRTLKPRWLLWFWSRCRG